METGRFDFGEATSQTAFDAYHAENPLIYSKLVQFAGEAVTAGAKHIGVGMLYERLRWFTRVEARDDTFKVNNNYRAFYARKLMSEYPAFAGLFEIRRSIADQGTQK